MNILSLGLSIAACALIFQMTVHLLVVYRDSSTAKLLALFMFGCGAYVIHPFFNWQMLSDMYGADTLTSKGVNTQVSWCFFIGFWLIAETTPWALWAFLHRVCRNTKAPTAMLVSPLIIVLLLDMYVAAGNFKATLYLNFSIYINIALILIATHEMLYDLRMDMSNRRRRFRNSVLITLLTLVLLVFYTESFHPTWNEVNPLFFNRLLCFIAAFAITTLYFCTKKETLNELFNNANTTSSKNQTQPKEGLSEAAQKLITSMEQEHLFKQPGISISALAERMNTTEYKLRDIIKNELGFQHFKKFINHFRVQYAATQLITNTEIPINEIMSKAGFNSHPPFHRAFREIYECTPVEYREKSGAFK